MSRDRRHDFPELPAVETLRDALYDARGVTLDVLRLDRLHPLWGGNKVFKLLPNLHRAEALGLRRVISFGGAYSNHLHALAAWGAEHGVQTVGIVRGEAPARPGPTLRELHERGMHIRHVSRAEYRRRHDPAWVGEVTRELMPALVIPEGGDNAEGFAGCRELGHSIAALAVVRTWRRRAVRSRRTCRLPWLRCRPGWKASYENRICADAGTGGRAVPRR